MDSSNIVFDSESKTIIIEDMSHEETLEALQYLIDNKYVDDLDFNLASFKCTPRKGPVLKLTCDYTEAPYNKIIIKTVNLKNTDPDDDSFEDIECGVAILKMFNLYMFESIEDVLKENSDKYIYSGRYDVWVNKNGSFSVKTRYGGFFITD